MIKKETVIRAIRNRNVRKIAELCETWEHTYERWLRYGSTAEIWAIQWKKKTMQAFRDAEDRKEVWLYVRHALRARRRLYSDNDTKYCGVYWKECDFYCPVSLYARYSIVAYNLPLVVGVRIIVRVWEPHHKLFTTDEIEKLLFLDTWWRVLEKEAKQIRPVERINAVKLAETWARGWGEWAEKAFREAKTKKELDIAFRLAQSAQFAYALEWLDGDKERLKRYRTRCAQYVPLHVGYEKYGEEKGFLCMKEE